MEYVFQSNDILEIILSKLPFYIVSSLLPVNTQFYNIGKVIYDNEIIKIYYESIDTLSYISKTILNHHLLSFTDKKLLYQIFNSYLHDLIFKNHWTILIYQPEFCEKFFLVSSEFRHYFHHHETMLHPLYLEYKQWCKLFQPIRKYLFIKNPHDYTLDKLRILATLKGIKRNYKLNKSELVHRLKFKHSKVYKLSV